MQRDTVDEDYRCASAGCCFDDAVWGQGDASEAARPLLQWTFDTLEMNRVQAETDTRNTAPARVLEKLGFAREGKFAKTVSRMARSRTRACSA